MINPKLLQTLEDRLNTLKAQLFGTCKTYDKKADLYSFIAAAMYNMDIDDCREYRQDGTPNPEGKELRNRVKQFLIPIIAECGGIETDDTHSTLDIANTTSECSCGD